MEKTKRLLIEKNKIASAVYGERVNALLRERYTLSEELSLLRRRDTAGEEFAEYNAFAEECKAAARAEMEVDA